MHIETFVLSGLAIQSYVVVDDATGFCAVIDAPRHIGAIRNYIIANNLTLKAVIETHVHADFISGAIELKSAFGGSPQIYCSAAGGSEWVPTYADVEVRDGDSLTLGGIRLQALHTPGHTPEHLTWLCFDLSLDNDAPVCAFTGDFLFVQGVGRPDLLGGDMQRQLLDSLFRSLSETLRTLPDTLEVLPSHGAGSLCGKAIGSKPRTTLGEERRTSAPFATADRCRWEEEIMGEMPAPPLAFARNKKVNVAGAPLLETLPPSVVVRQSSEVEAFLAGGTVLDFRDPQAFARSHIRGAVNVPFSPAVGNWLAGVVPLTGKLLCVVSSDNDQRAIEELLRLLGYDQPLGFINWKEIQGATHLMERLDMLTPQELKARLAAPNDLYIIDVRTPAEWGSGHIREAHHIELNRLPQVLDEIPQGMHVVAVCGSGWRSSIAASLLQRRGVQLVSHLEGGMRGWFQAGA